MLRKFASRKFSIGVLPIEELEFTPNNLTEVNRKINFS
jgi:hypothetical protein